jgi:hypothetical protein
MNVDYSALKPMFAYVRMSDDVVPECDVLFIYAALDPAGAVVGSNQSLARMIRSAGASIAVIASVNPLDNCKARVGANVVFTIDRNGEKLSRFFAEVFRRMYAGTSMLSAWVQLAPQASGEEHSDLPGTVMAAELGHIVFARSAKPASTSS